jgi:hypothetical protein
MQSLSEQIVVGVAAGVLTSAFLYFLGLIFWKVLAPWYREFVYAGADISGTWDYLYDGEDSFGSMTLTLRQSAHRIEGDASVTVRSPQGEERLLLAAEGSFWEGYVSLTLKSKDRKVVAMSNLLLKLLNNGASLEGMYSFRVPHTDLAASNPIALKRR